MMISSDLLLVTLQRYEACTLRKKNLFIYLDYLVISESLVSNLIMHSLDIRTFNYIPTHNYYKIDKTNTL